MPKAQNEQLVGNLIKTMTTKKFGETKANFGAALEMATTNPKQNQVLEKQRSLRVHKREEEIDIVTSLKFGFLLGKIGETRCLENNFVAKCSNEWLFTQLGFLSKEKIYWRLSRAIPELGIASQLTFDYANVWSPFGKTFSIKDKFTPHHFMGIENFGVYTCDEDG